MADIEIAATAWASLWLRQESGALQLCVTEGGDIGIYDSRDTAESAKALGVGDTIAEALEEAHARWHMAWPPEDECRCVELAEQGESLNAYRPAAITPPFKRRP